MCRPIKSLSQVHLVSEPVQGDLQQCSDANESRVRSHILAENAFPWHIEQFEEKMKHYPDSLIRKMTRDSFLKRKQKITYSQRQDLKH